MADNFESSEIIILSSDGEEDINSEVSIRSAVPPVTKKKFRRAHTKRNDTYNVSCPPNKAVHMRSMTDVTGRVLPRTFGEYLDKFPWELLSKIITDVGMSAKRRKLCELVTVNKAFYDVFTRDSYWCKLDTSYLYVDHLNRRDMIIFQMEREAKQVCDKSIVGNWVVLQAAFAQIEKYSQILRKNVEITLEAGNFVQTLHHEPFGDGLNKIVRPMDRQTIEGNFEYMVKFVDVDNVPPMYQDMLRDGKKRRELELKRAHEFENESAEKKAKRKNDEMLESIR
jgi:hypothetical protein